MGLLGLIGGLLHASDARALERNASARPGCACLEISVEPDKYLTSPRSSPVPAAVPGETQEMAWAPSYLVKGGRGAARVL